ncbi:hypothetical protein FOCC_FOCC006463 [Frankliniella occidentalis]|nr:hypothetical protein FOCC_FOCC006463 [Frankliniella occidentalis]
MTLSTEDCHGKKSSKARITVLLACNADGSEKLTPLTIGKSKEPRPFRGVRSLPCDYTNQPKAWMTGDIMISWLRKIDGKMRAQRRHIPLFIDNRPAHPTDLDFLTNVKVRFFPKNCTSCLQPRDQGVIHNLKFYYRKRLVTRLLTFIGRENYAWNQVKTETIVNCFKRAWFNFNAPEAEAPATSARAVAAVPTTRRRVRVRRDDDGSDVEGDPDVIDVTSEPAQEDADVLSDTADQDTDSPGEDDNDVPGSDDDEVIVIQMEDLWNAATQLLGVEGASLTEYIS